ncbi:MAG: hypothetical protein LC793_17215, partial [Thermomicrobia bacterium]|nr:hypothetical protein [Thermomicrobia bacterium]
MHDGSDESASFSLGPLSRRTLLRGIAAAGATTALGALLAACGSTSATNTPKAAGGTTGGTVAPAATTGSGASAPKKGGAIKAELDSDIANLDPMPSSLLVD